MTAFIAEGLALYMFIAQLPKSFMKRLEWRFYLNRRLKIKREYVHSTPKYMYIQNKQF